jgi:hypothetical protein
MTLREDLFFTELAAAPRSHLFDVGDKSLRGERRHDCLRIGEEKRLTGGALIPLHDGKVLFPASTEAPAHRHRYVPGAAVDMQQNGIAAIRAAYRNPLLDAADAHGLEPFDAVRSDDLARIRDDRGCFAAVPW